MRPGQTHWIADRRDAGVTLLEMLVVVALASILLALVFPAAGAGLSRLELRSAAARLAAATRYARDQAVYRQKTFQMEIDARAGTVMVADLEGGTPQRYQFPAAVQVAAILPEADLAPNGVRRFFFSPDGAAPEFEVVLRSDRRQMAVASDPLTGAAQVREQ